MDVKEENKFDPVYEASPFRETWKYDWTNVKVKELGNLPFMKLRGINYFDEITEIQNNYQNN